MRARGFPLKKASRAPREAFKGHAGTFSQRGNTIAYSYESPNGPADVIVTFDERRRPSARSLRARRWVAMKS